MDSVTALALTVAGFFPPLPQVQGRFLNTPQVSSLPASTFAKGIPLAKPWQVNPETFLGSIVICVDKRPAATPQNGGVAARICGRACSGQLETDRTAGRHSRITHTDYDRPIK